MKSSQFVEYNAQRTNLKLEKSPYKTGLWNKWEWQLNKRITTIDQLPLTWLAHDQRILLKQVCNKFPMAITPYIRP